MIDSFVAGINWHIVEAPPRPFSPYHMGHSLVLTLIYMLERCKLAFCHEIKLRSSLI